MGLAAFKGSVRDALNSIAKEPQKRKTYDEVACFAFLEINSREMNH
jgi:hypothetical protein